MAQQVTVAQMQGLYKEAYADGIVGLIPDVAYLVKNIQFGEAERVGNLYHQPVILTRETGITYSYPGAGAYRLAPSISMTMKDAQVQGSQTTLRSQIAYDTVARSIGSSKAFRKATLPIIESNLESHTKRLEIALIYGQNYSGLATANAYSNVSSTQTTLTISDDTWAVGIWGGEEGAKLVPYSTAGTLLGTSAQNPLTIVSVNPDSKTLTVSGDSNVITAVQNACAAGVYLYWYGVSGLTVADGGAGLSTSAGAIFAAATTDNTTGNAEMVGIDRIVTNTGTLFNVAGGTYNLWTGNTYNCGNSQLTMGKVFGAVNKAVGKGGLKEKVTVLAPIESWSNMMTDLAALRKFDDSYSNSQGVNGFESIKFHGANGEIEVVMHTCVKGGEAFVLPLKRFARVGATEITFNTPGRTDEIFLQIPDVNGFEIRSYCDQGVLCRTPAKCVKITGISPAA